MLTPRLLRRSLWVLMALPPLAVGTRSAQAQMTPSPTLCLEGERGVEVDSVTPILLAAPSCRSPLLQPDSSSAEAPFPEMQKHPVIAVTSVGFIMALGSYRYFNTPELQDNDHSFGEALRLRFTRLDRHRLDDNEFHLNHRDHPFSGRAYYGIARASNLSPTESVAVTALASSVWEYLIEIREVVSVNDQVTTIMGGSVLGEVFFQHESAFLNRAALSTWDLMGAGAYGFPFFLPKAMRRIERDGTVRPSPEPPGEIGAAFSLTYSSSAVGEGEATPRLTLGYESEVTHFPGDREPGNESRWIGDIPMSRLKYSLERENRGTDLLSSVVPIVWYRKSQQRNDEGQLEGYRLAVGPLWNYRLRTLQDGLVDDRWSTTGLLGLTADLRAEQGALSLRWNASVTADFAAIQAHALEEYQKTHELTNTKNVLQKHGYYYGLGATGTTKLQLRLGPLGLASEGELLSVRSIQGMDRWQPEELDDFLLQDARGEWRVEGSLELPGPVEALLATKSRSWSGEAKGVRKESRGREVQLGLRAQL